MTPLQATTLALYAAAAIAAVALTRRDPRHRPVAWYLCAVVGLDAGRWIRALLLEPTDQGPRVGWDLVLRSAEVGMYLASILALAALAWVVFKGAPSAPSPLGPRWPKPPPGLEPGPPRLVRAKIGCHVAPARSSPYRRARSADLLEVSRHHVPSSTRVTRIEAEERNGAVSVFGHLHDGAISIVSQIRRWFFDSPVPATWALLTAWLIADYPELSGAGLMRVYQLVEVGTVLFSGLCFARWLAGPRLLREGLSPAVACTLALISGPAATVAAPWLVRGTALEAWPGIVAANGVAVGITLVLQLHWLLRARRRLCSG